jgi:hypothetical protein
MLLFYLICNPKSINIMLMKSISLLARKLMAYIFALVPLIMAFFELMFSVISHEHQLQLFWLGGILDRESNSPIQLFQMHLSQCSHYILLNFGIICQPYGCCNFQHLFSMYITQLHQHLNGITNSLEAWNFLMENINFFLNWLFISYGVYKF